VVSSASQHPTLSNTAASTTGRSAADLGTSPAPQISHPSLVCQPTNRSSDAVHAASGHRKTTPTVPPKPKARSRPTGTDYSQRQPRPPKEQTSTSTGTEDRATLLARLHALEKVDCCKVVASKTQTSLRGHRLRTTPPTDELTTILQLVVQQICHIAMAEQTLGCGKFLSVGGEFVVQQVVNCCQLVL